MTPEKRLVNNILRLSPVTIGITQGIVQDTDGLTCAVSIGDAVIKGVRLRASLTERERQILIVPKVGSAVTVGSLTGDYADMVVLQVDEADSVVINGGHLGGLINIEDLTSKINELIEAFNSHTHDIAPGAIKTVGTSAAQSNAGAVEVPKISKPARKLDRNDYEDNRIKH